MKRKISVSRYKDETVVVYHNGKRFAKFKMGEPKKESREDMIYRKFIVMPFAFMVILMIVGIAFTSALDEYFGTVFAYEAPKTPEVIRIEDKSLPPILKKIAQCESGGQHFDKNGKVIKGKQVKSDIGKLQINEKIWGKQAKQLGYDIHSEEGNEQMAIWLLKNYGSVPWKNSGECWVKLLYKEI